MTGQLFAYGFRTFFAAAGASALLLVPAWAASFVMQWPLGTGWPPSAWHGHEMLFGFVGAAMAGFLLTAVPSATRRRGFAGAPLVAMSTVWLLGRVLAASSASWPCALVAVADLAFLPLLAAFVAGPLIRERNRNTPLLWVLLGLWLCNATFHLAICRGDAALASHALLAAADIVLVLVTVVGGRLLPSVTSAALRARGIGRIARNPRGLTMAAIAAMVAVAVIDVLRPGSALAGGVALVAAFVQAARLARWQGLHALRVPVVGVLHVAYAWLPAGLALKALALLGGVAAASQWLHALTIGVIATLILGVMTRLALGYTGRSMQAQPLTVLAYALLATAAALRAFGPALRVAPYPALVAASAMLWTAAFGLFLWVYLPMLVAPRADGRAG